MKIPEYTMEKEQIFNKQYCEHTCTYKRMKSDAMSYHIKKINNLRPEMVNHYKKTDERRDNLQNRRKYLQSIHLKGTYILLYKELKQLNSNKTNNQI
jgi:hypothetical protein